VHKSCGFLSQKKCAKCELDRLISSVLQSFEIIENYVIMHFFRKLFILVKNIYIKKDATSQYL